MTTSRAVCLHDKTCIENYLRKNVYLHLYGLGDLDDFFWPYTTWYGLEEGGNISAILLVYSAYATPVVLALSEETSSMKALLATFEALLPRRFYCHISPGVEEALLPQWHIRSHIEQLKMAWLSPSALEAVDCSQAVPLTVDDAEELSRFYPPYYAANSFDPRMLETKRFVGVKSENRIVAAAGVHVFSAQYRVAALGNIVTHPDHRRKGYAKMVVAKLCRNISEEVDHIGLNVKADNLAAINCYKALGFEPVAKYNEGTVESK